MDTADLPHSPAAERNREAILALLQRLLPSHGVAIELASGTGQHAQHFAAGLPGWRWHPSEADAQALPAIAARCIGSRNVLPPVQVDVLAPCWHGMPLLVDAVFCANLLHISPWPTAAGLMRGAARHLSATGRLLVYGPFFEANTPAAASNLAFDADLRRRNPDWGLRQLADVIGEANAAGLHLLERTTMPANNLMLVFGAGPGQQPGK